MDFFLRGGIVRVPGNKAAVHAFLYADATEMLMDEVQRVIRVLRDDCRDEPRPWALASDDLVRDRDFRRVNDCGGSSSCGTARRREDHGEAV